MLSAKEGHMLIRRLLCASIAISLAMVGRSSAQDATILRPNPKPLLPLLQVLDSANVSGSLEVSGACGSERYPQFPQLGQKTDDSVLTMLGEMLSSNRGVRVTQDSNKIVRIIGPDVPTDFLNVRISHITFEDYKHNGIFSANAAMWSVLAAPEVVAFFKNNDVEGPFPFEFVSGSLEWPTNSPHISGSLDNVSVEEVLDRILQTFPGVWFYGNCTQNEKHKRAVFLRFYRFEKKLSRVSGG
jgi:hypothetical protein